MSSTALSAQGTSLQINTTTAGAKTITAAAPGNPTIFTSAAHGLQNGDIVAIAAIVGTMSPINGTTQVVKNVTTNTFAVEYNSVGQAYTSGGTATPTAWATIANVKSFSGFDGSASVIDVSNLQSIAKEKRLGLQDNGQFSLELDLDSLDAGQIALLTARAALTQKQFKLTFPDTKTATFSGYCKKVSIAGGVDQVIKRSVDVEITGDVVFA